MQGQSKTQVTAQADSLTSAGSSSAPCRPVGAVVSAHQVVALMVGSDKLHLSGFVDPTQAADLPVWVPKVDVRMTDERRQAEYARSRRVLRTFALVGVAGLLSAALVLGFLAGRMGGVPETAVNSVRP